MAIDTVEKRLSIMDFGNIGFLYPTGSVDAAKRAAALGLYSGIALAGAGTTITASTEVLSTSTYSSTVSLTRSVSASTEEILVTANSSTITRTLNTNASTETIALTTYDATILGTTDSAVKIDGSSYKLINTDNGDCTIYFNGSNYFTYDSNVYYNY